MASLDPTTVAFIRGNYGYLAAFLDITELASLFGAAVKGKWDMARFSGALEKSKWWRTHTETQRAFIAREKTDPSTVKAELAARTRQVISEAAGLGVRLDAARAQKIARDSLYNGWADEQVRGAIAAEFSYQSGKAHGGPGPVAEIKQLAAEYAVNLSDSAVQQYARQLIAGTVSGDTLRAMMIEKSKSSFPALAAVLDSGTTVRQYADDYLQMAEKRLGVSAETINLSDPKWKGLLVQRDEKGNPYALTIDEAERKIMQDAQYGYDRSPDARQNAFALVSSLRETFGGSA